MVDGKFFDAGAYLAKPVPMAVDFGIVYEGFRTGVSQGIFTITQPGQTQHGWVALGTWLPAGMKPPEKHKKADMPVIDDNAGEGPPKLHRGGNAASSSDQTKPAPAPAPPATGPKPPETAKAPPPPVAAPEAIEDPNRPTLRRGIPSGERREQTANLDEPEFSAKPSASAPNPIQVIPAISDAGGPDPRPYSYDIKADEEAAYRKKMLQLAGELIAKAKGKPSPAPTTTRKGQAAANAPAFDDVHLRVFDLTTSNEPVLILSAKTRPPATGSALPQEITLVARTTLENDLHKLFFSATDRQHLDIAPEMELIDAVDADGDGRGELLFRRTFDNGSSYAIYRAAADQLWPLYEGVP